MAIIPVGQKFHTLTTSTVTSDLGSARANSGREVFTMQDILDTVAASGGGNAIKQYAVKITMSGDNLIGLDEIYNNTGLSFSWVSAGNTNNQVVGYATGGSLRDEANGIYGWCQTSQEGIPATLVNGIELFGATVLSFGGLNQIILTGVTLDQTVASTPQDIYDFDQGYDVFLIYNRILTT